jgi:uncharacterized protein
MAQQIDGRARLQIGCENPAVPRSEGSEEEASAHTLADAPIGEQVRGLEDALRCNPVVVAILERAPALGLDSYYLGARAIAQTVWNQLHGFTSTRQIKDYDLVYFDRHDLRPSTEAEFARQAQSWVADLGAKVDVTNEARVHEWYSQRFGRSIAPYRSAEHAISTWPTTASSVGVRLEGDRFVVSAPFGLRDLFAMVVRPNKAIVGRDVYEAKARRWAALWPKLTVLPW